MCRADNARTVIRRKKLRISWLFPSTSLLRQVHTHTRAYITHTHTHTCVLVVPDLGRNPMAYVSRHGIGSRRECKMRPRDTTGDKRGDSRMAVLYQARKYNRDVSLETGVVRFLRRVAEKRSRYPTGGCRSNGIMCILASTVRPGSGFRHFRFGPFFPRVCALFN